MKTGSKQAVPASRLLKCAVASAMAAGEHAWKNNARRTQVFKQFKHDVKLALDLESQLKAESVIQKYFPGHDILGEETVENAADSDPGNYEWVIDPIDGTVNFSRGLPWWCSSVAVRKAGKVIAGAVYSPAQGRLYTASVESAARCNGRRIKVSTTPTLKRAMIATGLDKSFEPGSPPLTRFNSIALGTMKARVMGSAALDVCQVAEGHIDGYYESGIYIWDIAAAGLIVQMAGGRAAVIKDLGNHRMSYAATNGRIQNSLTKLVSE